MNFFAFLLVSIFSMSADAALQSPFVCNNMVNNQMTDSFKQVTFRDDGVDFQIYENFLTAPFSDLKASKYSVAILNRKLKGSVEGEDYEAIANALLVLDYERKKVHVTLFLDGQLVIQEELNCKI